MIVVRHYEFPNNDEPSLEYFTSLTDALDSYCSYGDEQEPAIWLETPTGYYDLTGGDEFDRVDDSKSNGNTN